MLTNCSLFVFAPCLRKPYHWFHRYSEPPESVKSSDNKSDKAPKKGTRAKKLCTSKLPRILLSVPLDCNVKGLTLPLGGGTMPNVGLITAGRYLLPGLVHLTSKPVETF